MSNDFGHKVTCCEFGGIFVFGSNEAGIHGGGAAKHALDKHGAKWGFGAGPQGDAYAIPTKDHSIETMPIKKVAGYVKTFINYAKEIQKVNPRLKFYVTKIGCGLAGFTEEEIAPLFKGAPENCVLPEGWRD